MELKLQKIWSKILFVLLTLGFCFRILLVQIRKQQIPLILLFTMPV